jgi:hypothetical protein
MEETMATLALKAHTVEMDDNGNPITVPGGHAYIIFPEPRIMVKDLIAEKVRSELRKARAVGSDMCSLNRLAGLGTGLFDGPLDDQWVMAHTLRRFNDGVWHLYVDGEYMVGTQEIILLNRRTDIMFVVPKEEA